MAVKSSGGDPDANPALRRAIQNARAVNMPKDKIQNAIDKALNLGDTEDFQTVLYEGYGPHGIPMIVETATDNPTRTVANVRAAFNKENGNLGTNGSVAFMFQQLGVFRLSPEGLDHEELELALIDHGLEELAEGLDDDGKPLLLARCARDDFGNLQSGLEEMKIEPVSSGFEWLPNSTTELDESGMDDVLKLIARLEQDDDVQAVFHNLD